MYIDEMILIEQIVNSLKKYPCGVLTTLWSQLDNTVMKWGED